MTFKVISPNALLCCVQGRFILSSVFGRKTVLPLPVLRDPPPPPPWSFTLYNPYKPRRFHPWGFATNVALFFFIPNASRAAHYNNNTSSIRIGMDIFPQLSKSIDINHTHLNLAPAEAAFTAISVSVYVLGKHLKHSCWSEECTFSLKPRIFFP